MKCRFCATELGNDAGPGSTSDHVFLDLGTAPPSNAFLSAADCANIERYYPLKLFACPRCLLVQVDEVQSHAALFAEDYVYFSSFSKSWLEHAERYVQRAVEVLHLHGASLVVEIASNDGYLLQYVTARGIPCLGIEPTAGTARAAQLRGIETIVEFFGSELASSLVRQRRRADLIVANNVLAHVPDLNDFVAGLAIALAPQGVITVEFPHLQQLVSGRQFDTVYHEHFSYFSLHTACKVFAAHGLRVWDVERLTTHGGSLRLWVAHNVSNHHVTSSVTEVLTAEAETGMLARAYYCDFQQKADAVKNGLLGFLLEQHRDGRRVVAYGAAAKGNTLLNYAGVRRDLLPYVVDASPHKQGKFLPGSRIPVVSEDRIRKDRPDIVLILPWNLRDEIVAQLDYVRKWGGRFATAVPTMELD